MPHSVDVDRDGGRHEAISFCFHLFSEGPPSRGEQSLMAFCFLDRQGALADGLYGLNPRNTTGERITLLDRGSLSERDCRKLGPRGESNA